MSNSTSHQSNTSRLSCKLAFLLLAGIAFGSLNYLPKAEAASVDHCTNLIKIADQVDSGGADTDPVDDVPDQSDQSDMGFDFQNNCVSFTWDDTLPGGEGVGGNTGDACALFDTDGDGGINFALCAQVDSDGAVPPAANFGEDAIRFFSCDNRTDKPLNCFNAVETSFSTVGALSIVDDPFAGVSGPPAQVGEVHDAADCGGTDCATKDLQFTAHLDLTDFGDATPSLVNVCSYPSGPPNSNAFDCIVPPDSGFLVITKDAGDDTTTEFSFNVTPETGLVTDANPIGPITGGTSTDIIAVTAGPYTVTEILPDGWQLDTASCGPPADNGTFNDDNDAVEDISVGVGQTVICSFTNSLTFIPSPHIHLIKTGPSTLPVETSGDAPEAGDTYDYQFTVTNTGNTTLDLIRIVDELIPVPPNSILCVPTVLQPDPDASLSGENLPLSPDACNQVCANDTSLSCSANSDCESVGGSCVSASCTGECTATYALTQADINLGQVYNIATAQGDCTTQCDPDVTVEWPDDHLVDLQQAPALAIDKTASPSTYDAVDDIISYSYLVTNVGNVTISGPISVADDNVDTTAVCPAGDLAPTASLTCTASHTITQADLDAGSVTNVASASGKDPNGDPVTSPTDTETVTANQAPALAIDKTASPSTYDAVDDIISYSYLVTNVGNVTISGPISVADDNVDTTAVCPAGDLAPTASLTCTASHTITQADLDAGSVTNVASASGKDPNGDPVTSPTDTETVTANQAPALAIDKTASPSTYDAVDDIISYSYLVTNVGNVTISGPISVADDNVDTTAVCPAGDLAPTASLTCTASHTITQADLDAGSVTNVASASGKDPNGDPVTSPTDTETVTANQAPALAIDKTASPSTYDAVDDIISYSYLVTNVGNVTISGPISVADDNVDTTAVCPAGDLAPTASLTCTASHTITQADLDAGSVTNVASASGKDPNGDPVTSPTDTETVTAEQNPAITLEKTGSFNDENDDGFADAGETISYSFTVTNTGNVTLTDVSITDPGVTVSGGPIATLAPNASDSSTFTGSYTITQADVDSGSFYNLATACADDPNDAETCDDDDHNEPLPQNPAMSVLKSPDEQTIAQGTAANFTITVSNDGNVTLTNVTVSDPLAPECDRVFASIAVGSSEQYSCVATNVTTDFTNVATADSAETDPVSDTADVIVIPIVEFCENNSPPTALLMQYSGTDGSVYIVVEHTQDGVIFADTVADGGTFILEREDDGGNVKLNPELDVYIYDSEGGSLIDRIDIHTSCSLPLFVGQMFGTDLEVAKLTLLGEAVFGADPDAIEPSDILWRNTATGGSQLYEMDGANIVRILNVEAFSKPEWKIVGRGDYNGGGSLDILWRNEVTGQTWMYLMNGANVIHSTEVNNVTNLNWRIVGNGDYDGDGRSDILWRNMVTGQNWMYLMDGARVIASQYVNVVSNLDWQIVGSGDYNGDGRSDILWRNSLTGQNWMYLMNGANIMASQGINTVSNANWKIVGGGDYNGDGKSDILWRNSVTGQNWMYLMDGASIMASQGINTVSDSNWKIIGSGDYDADGKSDILWRNSVTEQNWLYLMDGNLILVSQLVSVEDVAWMVVNPN